MNEELKILIKVVSTEAKKNLSEVKKELNEVKGASEEAGSAVDKALGAIGKATATAIASVVALTGALVSLGKSAQEVQKGFEKLNTTFQNAGSSAKQASSTYKDLFSFLGDHDKAIETAQSLALITTETEELTEWSQILKGAWAQMGDKLPVEGLAEAANETIKVGQVVGVMADALNWAGVSEDAFNNALAQTTTLAEREALVRNTLNGLYSNSAKLYDQNNQATIQYNQAQANLNLTLGKMAAYLTPLITSVATLGTNLLTVLGPAIQTVSLYLTAFITIIAEAIQWVGNFFGLFQSSSQDSQADLEGYQSAMRSYTNSLQNYFGGSNEELGKTNDEITKIKKQLMGFDELNVVSSPDSSAIGGGGSGAGGSLGAMPVAPNIADYNLDSTGFDLEGFKADLDLAKEKVKGLLTLVGLVAAGLATWKLVSFLKTLSTCVKLLNSDPKNTVFNSVARSTAQKYIEGVKEKLTSLASTLLIVGGAVLLVSGYTDAWATGVDWGNLAAMIAGVGLVVGGLALQFGALGAQIGLLVAAVALFVLGVKDFIENGPTAQNMILILGGAVATAIAAATMGLGPLMGIVVGLVAGVVALTAAVLLEKPAIMDVKDAQEALNQAKEKAAEAEENYINAVDAAESSLKRLENAEKAAGMSGKDLYDQVQSGALDYKDLTDEQKELYKAYIDNEKKQQALTESTKALNEAKKAETLASYEHQLALAKESGNYDDFKKSVVEAFEKGELSAEEARDLIGKSMSEMSDDAQQTFMKDLPGAIKDGLEPSKYETVRKRFTDTWEKIWSSIAGFFNKYIAPLFTKQFWDKQFTNLKNSAKSALNGLIDIIERAINGIISKANTISWNVPDWVPLIGGKTFGFSLPKVSIPRLATGGLAVSSTLANIGEAGKEAILPLDRNTEWMDNLADKIASRNQAPSKIVLMVDGKELGWANINSINNITRQTGQLQLVF